MKVRSKRSRKGVKPNASFRSIVVREMTIQCFCGPGPRLLVPVDTGDVERIVEHLRPRSGEQHDIDSTFGRMLSDMDAGHIVWKSSAASSHRRTGTAGSWQIIHHNGAGQTKRTSSGLQVPATCLAGERLTADGLLDAANKDLLKARRLWNQFDCSHRPRLLEEPAL